MQKDKWVSPRYKRMKQDTYINGRWTRFDNIYTRWESHWPFHLCLVRPDISCRRWWLWAAVWKGQYYTNYQLLQNLILRGCNKNCIKYCSQYISIPKNNKLFSYHIVGTRNGKPHHTRFATLIEVILKLIIRISNFKVIFLKNGCINCFYIKCFKRICD